MDEEINLGRMFQILEKVTNVEIDEVICLFRGVTSEEEWQKFSMACDKAIFSLAEVIYASPQDKEDHAAARMAICFMRMNVYVDWQMTLREREAIKNPRGKLGRIRAHRLEMEEVLRRAEHAHHN